jgi:hypothetical protein
MEKKKRLTINILKARDLTVPSTDSRPYCIVELEMNEFVTKEAEVSMPSENDKSKRDFIWYHEATLYIILLAYVSDVLRDDPLLAISVWDRNGDETFLGMVKFRPPTVNGYIQDEWLR